MPVVIVIHFLTLGCRRNLHGVVLILSKRVAAALRAEIDSAAIQSGVTVSVEITEVSLIGIRVVIVVSSEPANVGEHDEGQVVHTGLPIPHSENAVVRTVCIQRQRPVVLQTNVPVKRLGVGRDDGQHERGYSDDEHCSIVPHKPTPPLVLRVSDRPAAFSGG